MMKRMIKHKILLLSLIFLTGCTSMSTSKFNKSLNIIIESLAQYDVKMNVNMLVSNKDAYNKKEYDGYENVVYAEEKLDMRLDSLYESRLTESQQKVVKSIEHKIKEMRVAYQSFNGNNYNDVIKKCQHISDDIDEQLNELNLDDYTTYKKEIFKEGV